MKDDEILEDLIEEKFMKAIIYMSELGIQSITIAPKEFKELRDSVKSYRPSSATALMFQGPRGQIRIVEGE